MKRRVAHFCMIAAALLTSVMLAEFAYAQVKPGQTQEKAYQVASVKIKPGMAIEWRNYLKNELIPLMKKSGVTEFETWVTEFGDPDEFVMLLPIKSMAELDGPSPFAAGGQEGILELMAHLQRMVNSSRFSMIQSRSNLTIAPKAGYVPKIGVLVTNTVAMDRVADFEKSSSMVMAAVGKTNAKGFLSSKLSLGGIPNTYYSLVLFDSFADLEQFVPAFVKALGEAKFGPETGIVSQREYEVLRYIPELSIQPAAP